MKPLFVLMALTLMVSAPARADPPKVAVFDFELMDTSLQGEAEGQRADEQGRLMHTGDQLRRASAESGKFVLPTLRRSMLRRTAAICRPAAAAMCNTRNSSALIWRAAIAISAKFSNARRASADGRS
jgi:hypothetical protein